MTKHIIATTPSSIMSNSQLIKLHEYSLILNSTHNIAQILDKSALAISDILGADGCHILFARKTRDNLHLETAIHHGDKPFPSDIDETQGISAQTFQTGQIIVVKDAENDSRVTPKIFSHFNHRSVVSAPIVSKGNILGAIVIYAFTPEKFSEQDGEYLLLLGNHLGLAVENAQLMMQIKKAAITDSLTGTFNRRHFIDELQLLLESKPNDFVSLIVIDVNDLKVINDTFGHTTGDKVLLEVATLLKSQVQEQDVVSRYGGDEFAIISPGANSEEALKIATRIEQALAKHVFKDNLQGLEVSISWGIVSARYSDIHNISEFINAADQNMYRMKRTKKTKE
jgi:diguanylate cyclase (GGDEF)-like protein